uniref:Huntingtin n=2 Tax=Saccoglossus kowalevskii TaxID=10224 RepID=A0ABM0MSJ4_SACKO|nr:PREDICTED: huntingtin [Saccoglossus kowalevskii]
MANMEKLVKAFEALKAFQQGSGSPDESGQSTTGTGVSPGFVAGSLPIPVRKKEIVITKKDRVTYLTIIADAMCTPNFKSTADFPKFLGISMETFLIACDDPEPDVRMNADECLNRTIKTLLETNLGRLQVELYKEIKKNNASRSLRAALWRFADLAHLIRPQKCRPYVVNLVPCIQRIARRQEEPIQVSLGTFMSKILPVLGRFTNDTEVKVLLKTFLPNLKSTSAATRRTASSSLSAICQHSRKPPVFYAWLVNVLLGMVIPIHEERKSQVLLGVLLCFRHIMPHLAVQDEKDHGLKGSFGITRKEEESGVSTEQLIQIYELVLYYSQFTDHNVVTASLETLYQLLRTPHPQLLNLLLSPQGIKRKTIFVESLPEGLPRQNTSDQNLEGQLNRISSVAAEDESSLEDFQDESMEAEKLPGDQTDTMATDVGVTYREDELTTPLSPVDGHVYCNVFQDDSDMILQNDSNDATYSNVEIGDVDEDLSPQEDVFLSHNTVKENFAGENAGLLGKSSSLPGSNTDIRVNISPSGDKDRTPDSSRSATPREAGSMEHLDIYSHSRESSSSSLTASGTARIRDGDIGSYTDNEVPLVHCVRLMCAAYLLTGYKKGLIPDKLVRVSVKGLALGCVGNAISLFPKVFFAKLFKPDVSGEKKEDEQLIRDILLYIRHLDPQMRGNTAILIGQLIKSVVIESKYKCDSWLQTTCEQSQTKFVPLDELISLLISGLEDDFSGASKSVCSAVKICLRPLCNSIHGDLGLKLILSLLPLSDNSYWLVKVKLLDVLSSIDFKVVHFLEDIFPDTRKGDNHFVGRLQLQGRVIENVIIQLLSDEDARVRDASAKALVALVSWLFYAMDHPQHDPIIAVAKEHTNKHLDPIIHEQTPYTTANTTAMREVSIFNDHTFTPPVTEESALSRVVDKLVKTLNSCTSKYLLVGTNSFNFVIMVAVMPCVSCPMQYPVSQYASAWGCASITTLTPKDGSKSSRIHRQTSRTFSSGSITSITSAGSTTSTVSVEELSSGSGGGVLPLILALLTSSSLPLDLSGHQDALQLAGNLMAGAAFKSLRTNHNGKDSQSPEELTGWSAVQDPLLVPLADQLLQHLARLLNVCAHVIEGNQPGPPKIQPSLPSLSTGTSLSPIKKKTKSKEKDGDQATSLSSSPLKSQSKDHKQSDKHEGSEKDSKDSKTSKTQLGAFFHLPQYMRLYDVLKGAYSNYKITLDLGGTEKFGSLLKTALDALTQLLEFANFTEIGKYSEELLGFLKSTVQREPTATILTVQQLLKALFSTNLGSQSENATSQSASRKPGKATRLTSNMKPGLYHSCIATPYTQFTQSLSAASFKPSSHAETEHESSGWFSWMRKKSGERKSSISKPGSKDKVHIHSYIRLFEPLVIKALKQYTITSSLTLQQQVLHLLAQLVQLRVNYCLLDSDQIFIGFVIKQFEFIEEGQIKDSENLIPHIFHFLVLLSYERYHTKAIIGMPKIIQLCDGIMASGQQASTHAIPALRPIVHDLFVLRGSHKADSGKELDTQREVVVSMLIRLIQFHEVLDLFIIVLQQHHKESEDKWKRLSRQVIDMVLPRLAKQQVNLDNQQGLDTLHRLLESVASSALRPVDMLLKTLFMQPYDVSSLFNLQRWLSLVLAVLRVIISQSKEEVILTRLQELNLQVNIFTYTHTCAARNAGRRSRPSSASGLPENAAYAPETPEEIFARFLLQVIGLMVTELSRRCCNPSPSEQPYDFLATQLSHLLLYVTHMFKTGSFRRAAFKSLRTNHNGKDSQSPEELTGWSAVQDPLLVPLADQLLQHLARLLNVCAHVIEGNQPGPPKIQCENLTDAEPMTWLIINHVSDIIDLSHEPPVLDFISAIHRNPAASGLFIQALHLRCESFSTNPCMLKRTLNCLLPIHLSQSGALLTLLIDKFSLTYHHALARLCDMAACRRVEMLLAENAEECETQIPIEDLQKLMQHMRTSGLTKKYTRLTSLLMKLKCYLEGEDIPPTPSPSDAQALVAKADINKDWYMSVVRECCFTKTSSARECSLMLQKLEYWIIIHWHFMRDILPSSDHVQTALECLSQTLQYTQIFNVIGSKENLSWACSAIGCVYQIFTGEFHKVGKACDQTTELVECLQSHLSKGRLKNTPVPPFLAPTMRNVIIGLARLPLVNSYARTPSIAWKMGWMPTPSGPLQTKLPPLPVEYLQDKEVLKQFLYRVNVLGWTSRQQFEETWAALLGVLSSPPMSVDMSIEEEIERTQSSCLAVRAITSLLVRTLMKPEAGNPTNSVYRLVSRHSKLPFLTTPMGRKLCALREEIEMDIRAIIAKRGDHCSHHEYQYTDEPLLHQNLERELNSFHYSLGQLSIPSVGSQLNLPSPVAEMPHEIEEGVSMMIVSNAPGKLDVHSCLMFLLELYGQWMSQNVTPKTPLMLLCETVKSVLSISDIFTEHAQYEWMFDTLLEVQKNHPLEDELITQYIIPGICKAAAVLGMFLFHIPINILCSTGVQCRQVSLISCIVSQQHVLAMLSTSFYLIEHYAEHIKDTEFTYNIIQICISMASSNEEAVSPAVYHAIMRGFERLLLAGCLSTSDAESLVKCSVDRLCMASPHRAMSALGLMLTCMYTGKERDQKKDSVTDQSDLDAASHDPERLLIAMERVTVLFDRIRKGFPSEARVIARILPTFLIDFFPPQDIMNKVIGEFLSSQQPHPQLMARVVFKVFSKLHQQGQTVLVRDWVMLSLSNFTQRTPVSMAIWSLTCFFISSSTNMWICALLPHVIGRMGKLETIDKRNFCVAALDFYRHQLVEEAGKRAFISIFQSVANPGGPYAELLAACNANNQ